MSSEAADFSEDERLSPTVCYLCRQRKTKCDRKLPKCGFCIKAKVDCHYIEKRKKRGLRAGYVSELEARIESLEQDVKELKDHNISSHNRLTSSNSTPTSSQPASHSAVQQQRTSSILDGPHENVADANAAVSDMMSLPHAFYHHLLDQWFKETQTWVPILNRERLQASLAALPTPVNHINDIELRSVIALEISYSTQAISLGYRGRRRLSQYLRSQVLVDAMAKPSMSSLRALVIIAILDYGTDDMPSTFSLLAICRRMSENIGTFRQLLKRIEAESPTQVGPPAIEMPNGDDAIPLTWCILALDAVTTLGVSWRDVSAALVDHLSSVAFISTPDFRNSFRTHTHLAAIGLQPVHEFISAQARYANAAGNPLEICEEIYQNLISYVDGLPETSYSLLADGSVDFDVCQIFTRVLSHSAVIMVYQRFVFQGNDDLAQLAQQRCLASCATIIATIRNISDADTEVNNSPVFATLTFVAARFRLALYRALTQPREPLFDVLMHGINMLGRRWEVARRLDIVLRAAINEVDDRTSSLLPANFWDLQKSHLDISEELKAWVIQHKPSLYLGNLVGPYM